MLRVRVAGSQMSVRSGTPDGSLTTPVITTFVLYLDIFITLWSLVCGGREKRARVNDQLFGSRISRQLDSNGGIF